MSTEEIEFEIAIPESAARTLVEAIEAAGGAVEDGGSPFVPREDEAADHTAAGFEPLTLIAAAASVALLVQTIAKVARNKDAKGGTVVDTRGKKVRVRKVANMTAGRLVVVGDDGTRVIEEPSDSAVQGILTEVVSRLGKKA